MSTDSVEFVAEGEAVAGEVIEEVKFLSGPKGRS